MSGKSSDYGGYALVVPSICHFHWMHPLETAVAQRGGCGCLSVQAVKCIDVAVNSCLCFWSHAMEGGALYLVFATGKILDSS